MRVRDIMTTAVVTVTPETSVKDLLQLWHQHPFSGFPVVEGDRLVGVVTESDLVYRDRPLKAPAFFTLLDAVIPLESPQHLRDEINKTVGNHVRDLMSHPPITLGPEASVAEAAAKMTEQRINRLPIVDETGKLLGLLSRTDIIRTLG